MLKKEAFVSETENFILFFRCRRFHGAKLTDFRRRRSDHREECRISDQQVGRNYSSFLRNRNEHPIVVKASQQIAVGLGVNLVLCSCKAVVA